MTRKTIEERLLQLEAQKKTLQARLSKQERAADTRRKILLGAFVLDRLENRESEEFCRELGEWLRRELPGFLSRDADQALFAELWRFPEQVLAETPDQDPSFGNISLPS